MTNSLRGISIRSIGRARAEFKIGFIESYLQYVPIPLSRDIIMTVYLCPVLVLGVKPRTLKTKSDLNPCSRKGTSIK